MKDAYAKFEWEGVKYSVKYSVHVQGFNHLFRRAKYSVYQIVRVFWHSFWAPYGAMVPCLEVVREVVRTNSSIPNSFDKT